MPVFAQIQFQLFPERASTTAERVDALFFFLTAVTGVMGLLVTTLIIYFAVKYRRRSEHDRTPRILGSLRLELIWTIGPFIIFLIMFVWGASVYLAIAQTPDDAIEIYVVGKQWMWKVQHLDGQREINELHVPVGRRVKLTLTSEDVIHSFFVPAFRTKIDAVPGRYVQTWFEATKTGRFHLFCAEYCGTYHSGMIGSVHVLEEEEYHAWLDRRAEGSPALEGRKLFLKLQCVSCHTGDAQGRAPSLEGLFGRTVVLQDGRRVTADASYIRRSILRPQADVVAGWQPIMPSYDRLLADEKEGLGQEEAIIRLIAYIRSLDRDQTPVRTEDFPPPEVNPATSDKMTR
ncbi:MAG TPA: cytochrome c oxidase subunit II [Gemmataceae bacterium]|nr:cytochrome c oxidase subunit II [Gemmataceae bacterium]